MEVHVFSFWAYYQTEKHVDLTFHALMRSVSTEDALFQYYADSVDLGILHPLQFSRTYSESRLEGSISCVTNGKGCVVMVVKTRGSFNFSYLLPFWIMKMTIKLGVVWSSAKIEISTSLQKKSDISKKNYGNSWLWVSLPLNARHIYFFFDNNPLKKHFPASAAPNVATSRIAHEKKKMFVFLFYPC
jgi:hypothetical protein